MKNVFQKIFGLLSSGAIYRLASFVMSCLNKCIPVGENTFLMVEGHKMYPGTFDRYIAAFLWKKGMLESFEADILKCRLKEGMTVLDIGANIGRYTLMMAEGAGDSGKVIAFEPDRDLCAILKRNVEANNLRNVEISSNAIGDKNGEVVLSRNRGNRGDNTICSNEMGMGEGETVECVTLDTFLPQGTKIDLIKMDIQGAEAMAFAGMKRVLNESAGIVVLAELTPSITGSSGYDVISLVKEFINSYGFKVSYIDEKEKRLIPVNLAELEKMCEGGKGVNICMEKV
ncbi:FkbM family methyltransferase [Candidatus Auribacterota bacterium]